MSQLSTEEEEQEQRQDAVVDHVGVMRSLLPGLLKDLAKIPDPRSPRKVKHQLTVLMVYGILMFVFQMASRREANRTMTLPAFRNNLKALFPELEGIPHHDTLYRLLTRIDVERIPEAHVGLVRTVLKRRRFRRQLIDDHLPIAIDGSQKLARDVWFSEECCEREVGSSEEPRKQYYVYVLEACLAFEGGLTIPLMTEFLTRPEDADEETKQDCEQKAFRRLAPRLKAAFPRQRIMILLDGLYPNGPVFTLCRGYSWQFMMVLKDNCLTTVWEDAEGLMRLEPTNRHRLSWGGRWQDFRWANHIEYTYKVPVSGRKKLETVHVVVCDERWEEVDRDSADIVTRTSRHAWISSTPLNHGNLHERCNLAARHRWAIESCFLVEKHHGYKYEHCFAYDWNAMKGYHYLMRLAHLFNVLAQHSVRLVKLVRELTVQGLIRYLRETVGGRWLDRQEAKARLAGTLQIRLE